MEASGSEVRLDVGLGELILGGAGLVQIAAFGVPWPADYRALFTRWAPQGSRLISPNLLHALAWHESKFNPAAVGAVNSNGTRDYGLMQINSVNLAPNGLTPYTALTDVNGNVRAAVAVLQEGEANAKGLPDLISIYNAGQAAGGGPKKHADGSYVNAGYVSDVYGKWLLVTVASFAPYKRGTV